MISTDLKNQINSFRGNLNALKFLTSTSIFVCFSFFINLTRSVDLKEERDPKN